MTMHWPFATLAFLGLGLVACASRGGDPPAPPRGDAAKAGNDGLLTGTVAYRERMALPPDAVAEVWVTDVSPGNMVMAITGNVEVRAEGRQVPLPFELRYDAARIEPDHDYAVKAVIRSGGMMLFATDSGVRVITKGAPTRVELRLKRTPEGSDASPGAGGGAAGLDGTAWRLEDLGGAGVLDRTQATLEFPGRGRVAGNASCNRFFGSVEIAGDSITFGTLGATLMACPEAVMNQEARYLKALEGAERFTQEGTTLLVHAKGMNRPLRFFRREG